MSGRATARLSPGDVVVGRHRLLREVGHGGGTTLWQAEDEVLARAVAVRVLTDPAPEGLDADTVPLEGLFLAAALRAGRLSDPRVASVYDAAEEDGVPLVVREWVEGQPLSSVLQDGPLPSHQVARIGVEIAAALTAAHARDVGHGALHPGDVVLTVDGVKLTDLEVAAALEGRPVPTDPGERGARDAQALGAVLYAASTGCWPVGAAHGLPGAPTAEGRVCTPHQVRAAVPRGLDAVITSAIAGRYRTPGDVAVDLAPMTGARQGAPAVPTSPSGSGNGLGPAAGLPEGPAATLEASPWRHGLVLVLVLALVAAAGWTMGLATGRLDQPLPRTAPASPVVDDSALLRPVAVEDFDPPPGDGQEKPAEARLATDGDPTTAWTTDTYRNRPDLGGLKPGVGVLLDLGDPATLSGLELLLGSPGGTVEVRGGLERPERAEDLPLLTTLTEPPRTVEVPLTSAEPVRYVLLWFTNLPPRGAGYGAGISEVTLSGHR